MGLRMLTSFLCGIVLTGLGAYFAYPHDLPTKNDLGAMETSIEKQMSETQAQVATIQAQNASLQDELTEVRITQAKVDFKLGISEDK
jgi:hypothetical protein